MHVWACICVLVCESLCLGNLSQTEPGIRRGNEDSRGNKNRKSWKKNFSAERQIDKHTLFLTVCRCSRKYGNHAVNECEFASKIDR